MQGMNERVILLRRETWTTLAVWVIKKVDKCYINKIADEKTDKTTDIEKVNSGYFENVGFFNTLKTRRNRYIPGNMWSPKIELWKHE